MTTMENSEYKQSDFPDPPRKENRIKALVEQGDFFLLNDFAGRNALLDFIRQAFRDAVSRLEGPAGLQKLSELGAEKMHEIISPNHVADLRRKVEKALVPALYQWTVKVGREDLGLDGEFYVDAMILVRIHFPFEVARKAREGKRLLSMLRPKSRSDSLYQPERYHRNLPRTAWSHGPHKDTWYGHSFDGINFWLSYAGCGPDNGLLLYPEFFAKDLEYEPGSMYVAPGTRLPRPKRLAPPAGSLLLFNPEVLHGTQLNVSDQTRITVATRLNPDKPRFGETEHPHFEKWLAASDVEARGRARIQRFPADSHRGRGRRLESLEKTDQRRIFKRKGKLRGTEPLDLGSPSDLLDGAPVEMVFEDGSLVVIREPEGIIVLPAKCPHLGINLADGSCDRNVLNCPGHGLRFDLSTGRAYGTAWRISPWEVWVNDGRILARPRSAAEGTT